MGDSKDVVRTQTTQMLFCLRLPTGYIVSTVPVAMLVPQRLAPANGSGGGRAQDIVLTVCQESAHLYTLVCMVYVRYLGNDDVQRPTRKAGVDALAFDMHAESMTPVPCLLWLPEESRSIQEQAFSGICRAIQQLPGSPGGNDRHVFLHAVMSFGHGTCRMVFVAHPTNSS